MGEIKRRDIDPETLRVARTFAPDFYLSALLAPPAARADLVSIAAFFGDVDRIVLTVGEPPLAEIRLQWWRDALSGGLERGERSGSPVADGVLAAASRHGLPLELFDRLLEARTLDLYADPLADEAALSAYCQNTYGATMKLNGQILGVPSGEERLATAAAEAYGRARILCLAAAVLARGRQPFPDSGSGSGSDPNPNRDADPDAGAKPTGPALTGSRLQAWAGDAHAKLTSARPYWRGAGTLARIACLPLGLVRPYLTAVTRPGHDPNRAIADISPLQRTWRLWRARRFGFI